MFRLPQSNHHQTVYQKYKKEIILHIISGLYLGLTSIITRIYVFELVKKTF